MRGWKYFLMFMLFFMPLLCQAQLKTITKPAPKPAATQKPAVKKLYTEAGTVTDIDGNIYKSIKIGDQVWMAENLKTGYYNDGSVITNVTENGKWGSLNTGAWCYYNNDAGYNNMYGKLYNWYAVNTGKLSPKGWHVATYEEWNILIKNLGGAYDAGGKMKITSNEWNSPNTGASNLSGFSAVPGGWRNSYGSYELIGQGGNWWTASVGDNNGTWFQLYYNSSSLYKYMDYKEAGFSVRCIKD